MTKRPRREREITGKLAGLFEFAQAWNEIATRLIAAKKAKLPPEKWPNLEFAPDGHWAAVVDLNAGADFVTVARRALEDDRRFERAEFAGPVLAAELQPFGAVLRDLSSDGRARGVKRVNKSIDTFMATFVFFDLFEPINKNEHTYRLTDLGVSIYENLSTEAPTASAEENRRVLPLGGFSGLASASWGHTQVALRCNW